MSFSLLAPKFVYWAGAVACLIAVLLWLWYREPSAEMLVDRAIAGDITGDEPALKHHHAALKRAALTRLDDLTRDDTQALKGLARIVAGMRYWQVAREIDSTAYAHVRRSLLPPDTEIVDLLSKIWLSASQNDYEGLSGLVIVIEDRLDFRTSEAFSREVWDESGPQGRVALAHMLGNLLTIALDSRERHRPSSEGDGVEVAALGGWDGYPPRERERIQDEMKALLNEWVIPTMRAAARGEDVPPEDTGAVRNTLRALGVDKDKI